MTRMSKQGERRNRFPRKNRSPAQKTGPKKDNLSNGFKNHEKTLFSSMGSASIYFLDTV